MLKYVWLCHYQTFTLDLPREIIGLDYILDLLRFRWYLKYLLEKYINCPTNNLKLLPAGYDTVYTFKYYTIANNKLIAPVPLPRQIPT